MLNLVSFASLIDIFELIQNSHEQSHFDEIMRIVYVRFRFDINFMVINSSYFLTGYGK